MLLDEIEKASAEVFDVLLQILDDGRLTDGQGRTVDFRNTVIVMTSNVRSTEALREFFRPEFLNRIDEVVEFHPLSREQIGEIVELQLRRLRERLADRGLSLELTDEAKELVAEAGWDPTYGARPLKRALQRLVENPLAMRLLEGDFAEGDTVRVDAATASSCSRRPRRFRPQRDPRGQTPHESVTNPSRKHREPSPSARNHAGRSPVHEASQSRTGSDPLQKRQQASTAYGSASVKKSAPACSGGAP